MWRKGSISITARRGWALAALIVVVVLGYYALSWKSFAAFTVAIDHCNRPFCDFYAHYYPMAQEVFRTNNPVPGFFYSPFFAILLAGFKPLTVDAALLVWGILQVLLVAALVLAPRFFKVREVHFTLLHLFLVLMAFPVIHNFKWGQVSVLLVLSLLACFYFYERGNVVLAACLLAFAVSLKFFPALFAVYFAFRRDWRFLLAWAAACAAMLVGIPILAMGWDGTIRYYDVLQKSLSLAQGHVVDPNSQYLPNVVRRLWVAATFDGTVPYHRMIEESTRLQTGLQLAGYALAAANLVLLYLLARRGDRTGKASAWGFVIIALTTPLVVHTSWPHYFVYLPFCQVFLWREIVRDGRGRRGARLGLLIAPSIVLASTFLFNAMAGSGLDLRGSIQSRSLYPFWGCLFASNALLLVAAYVQAVGSIWRRSPRPVLDST